MGCAQPRSNFALGHEGKFREPRGIVIVSMPSRVLAREEYDGGEA
jgi:hypothetical protein